MALSKDNFKVLMKHIIFYTVFLIFCNPCMGANKHKHFTVTKTHEGYVVKTEGKVINQLFVLSMQKINNRECLILRVVLNHGYTPNYTPQFTKVNYHDFIQALSSVIKTISATYKLSNLYSINIDLISLGDECLRITADYKHTCKERVSINSQNVLSVLWHSILISDIQRILSNYHLIISNMKIEMPFYTNWKEFSSYNVTNRIPADLVSNKVLRGIVYIYCRNSRKEIYYNK